MIYIGNHVSIADGYLSMGKHEKSLGGNTFAFFTRNPRGGEKKEVSEEEIQQLNQYLKENHFGPLVAHMPYTMNLCSDKEDIRSYSLRIFLEDLELMEKLPGNYLNFHPGSHLKQGVGIGIDYIVSALNKILPHAKNTTILLETMAGKGSEVGRTFDELKMILESVNDATHLAACLDTCHVFDAGYDIRENLDAVLQEFDLQIGLEKLKAIHLNDTKNPFCSHKDRHEKLGLGYLGKEAIIKIIQHPLLQGKPFILETPNEDDGYQKEIAFVKENMINA